mgnify:CR=1 FL=1
MAKLIKMPREEHGPSRPVDSPYFAAQVAELAHEIWSEHYAKILSAEQIDYMLTNMQSAESIWKDIRENNYHYYLLLHEGMAIGYFAIKYEIEKRTIFLSKIYVLQKYRGQGYGKWIIKFISRLAKIKGCESIWLTVNKNNTLSIHVYNQLGFRTIDSIVTDIGGGFLMDDYVMRKELI